MVVGGILRNVAPQLTQLDLLRESSLETTEQHFPLAGLQTVHHAGQRAYVVLDAEQNQLPVYEVTHFHLWQGVVQGRQGGRLVGLDPLFPLVRILLVEY